jgi:catechol 2,3-dioxygenase-like lactoylglutathione lyase family enzyme
VDGSQRRAQPHAHRPVSLEVGLVSVDPDGLERFLVDGLGFEREGARVFPQGEVRRFRREDARCKVFAPAGPVERSGTDAPCPDRTGFAYAALLADDAAAALAQAVAAGAAVLAELAEHRPGARMAMVRDPQGNVWELLEEPRADED